MDKKLDLGRKILGLCILLAIIICTSVCISGYYRFQQSTYKIYNDFGYDIAQIAQTHIDGDKILTYLESGETDEAYDEMAKGLYTLYKESSISAIYICIPNIDDLTLTNIYDVRIHDAENKDIYALGVIDPMGNDNPQLLMDIYETGERVDDYFLRETSFGYNVSSIVAVEDSSNTPVALLVVDVPMLEIQNTLNSYLIYTIILTVLLVLGFMFFFHFMLQKSVVKPLRLISHEASEFAKDSGKISKKLTNIKTGDEIETLAKSVHNMEVDINKYISDITVITKEKERIGAELSVATNIQASMLPSIFPAFPERSEFDIFASMTPAKEVGGDFYDFFLVDNDHLAMVMADVSGKGVPAALFMVISKTLLKNCTQTGSSPKEVLEKVNNQLCEGNDAEMFVTVWLGIYEISTRKLMAANAGHEYPVIKRENGEFELYKDKHGFVLAGMEGAKYREYELQLNKGDKLFVYTDGVPEATNINNELYGTERMLYSLNKNKDNSMEDILSTVKKDVDKFVGNAPQFDDITMLGIEFLQ